MEIHIYKEKTISICRIIKRIKKVFLMSLLEYELDYFLFIVDQNYRIFIENSEAMGFFKIPFLFDKLKMKRVFFSYMLIWHLEKNVLKWGVGIKPHLTGFQNP